MLLCVCVCVCAERSGDTEPRPLLQRIFLRQPSAVRQRRRPGVEHPPPERLGQVRRRQQLRVALATLGNSGALHKHTFTTFRAIITGVGISGTQFGSRYLSVLQCTLLVTIISKSVKFILSFYSTRSSALCLLNFFLCHLLFL